MVRLERSLELHEGKRLRRPLIVKIAYVEHSEVFAYATVIITTPIDVEKSLCANGT